MNFPTKLSTITAARNDDFKKLSFIEISERITAQISGQRLPETFSELLGTLDRLTLEALELAQLYVEYHLHRSEFLEAFDFAKDVSDLMEEAA